VLFSSRRAEVRWAAVVSSRGIGLPSAVEGTREVEDEFGGWKRSGGKAKGRECLLLFEGRLDTEAALEVTLEVEDILLETRLGRVEVVGGDVS